MSNPGQPQDTPQVQVLANPSAAGNSAFAGGKNQALELAGALADISPAANEFARAYATEAMTNARASAQKKALSLNGQGYAEAVRTGKIDATASPWWITAYKQEAGKVNGQNIIADLNTRAASWAEQNDPQAFRTRYANELADASKNITDPEEQLGFNAAAQPGMSQALAANTEKNVQAITADRIQNVSALVTQTIMETVAKNGGVRPKAGIIQAALAPLHQQWTSTGGRDPDWNNKIIVPGVLAAALHTYNTGTVDIAKDISNGHGGSIYDEAGAAEQLETVRHRIEQDGRYNLSLSLQMDALKREQDSRQAQSDLFTIIGPSMYTQGASQDQLSDAASQLAQKGHTPAAIASAFETAAKIGNSYKEIASSRYAEYENSQGGAQHVAALHQEATTLGWTPAFGDQVGQLALQGSISVTTQEQLIDQARKRSLALATRPGVSPNSSSVFNRQAQNIHDWTNTRQSIIGSITDTTAALQKRSGVNLSPTDALAVQDAAINATTDYLQSTPLKGNKRDFPGAISAGKAAANNWIIQYLHRNGLVQQ